MHVNGHGQLASNRRAEFIPLLELPDQFIAKRDPRNNDVGIQWVLSQQPKGSLESSSSGAQPAP